MSLHRIFLFIALVALLWRGVPAFAAVAPMVGATGATPGTVTAGTPTVVTVTAVIPGTPLAGGVNLVRQGAGGQTTVLGVMHDDGLGGDAVAGDGTYTLQITLNEPAAGTVSLLVTVAFKGQLKRVQSAPFTVTVAAASPAPQITSFSPPSAQVGQPVTVVGTGFTDAAGDAAHVLLTGTNGTVEAGVTASSATSLTFTVPVGAVSGPITVKVGAQSAASATALTITSSTPPVLSPSAAGINVLQGQSATYVVSFGSDPGFTQLATLSVSGLPSGVTGAFSPPAITSGEFSNLTVTAAKSQPTGDFPLTITATVPINGVSQSQSISVTLHVLPVTTSFIGRTVVDDALETPLAGVTVRFLGKDSSGNPTGANATTVSDASGNFMFTNLPAIYTGSQIVAYDGSTATSPAGTYAGVNLSYTLVGNQVTTPDILIHLPRIDNAETVMVPQNAATDQTFTFKTIPNLSVTVYAGTTFTMKDGTQPNPFPLIAIQVPVDRLPDTMPQMQNGLMPFIVAFQPANTTASQPVAVTFPNTLMTAPNTDLALSTLDPTKGLMVQYGTGTVTANGTQIVPDPDPAHPGHRYGLVHFDWHGPIANLINAILSALGCGAGDPIDIGSGIFTLETTDLTVNGSRGSLALTREYRTFNNNIGPFGLGSSHNYNYQLDTNALSSSAVINLLDPHSDPTPFSKQADGAYRSMGMPATQGAVLIVSPDNSGADLRFKDGTIFHFVPFTPTSTSSYRGALLTKITDRNGNVTTLTRNSSNPLQLTKVTDPVGRSLTFAYTNSEYPNLITSVTDTANRTVQYAYTDTTALLGATVAQYPVLTSVTNPAGGVTQYGYQALDNGSVALTTVTDARGNVTGKNVFDANGRVIQQTEADGGVITFQYSLLNALVPTSPVLGTTVTDPLGRKTSYRFNPQGYSLGITDPSGQSHVFDLDPGTNQILDIQNGTIFDFYLVKSAVPGVSARSAPPSLKPADSNIYPTSAPGDAAYTYDANGNVLTATDAQGNTTTFTYDPVYSQVTSITDALGHTSTFTYDTHGNLLTATDANGKTTTFAYNQYGQPTQITDPLGHQVAVKYDSTGNPITVTDPLGHTSSVKYDAVSRPIQATDALGRVSSIQYDALNRVLSQTDPLGHQVNFTYDPAGNLLILTDALGHQNSFTYDAMNRLLTRKTPLGKVDTRQYDLAGNLIQFTDRRGQVSKFGYDNLDQLNDESYQDGSVVFRTYDAFGRQVGVYDGPPPLVSFVGLNLAPFQYSYDLDNNLIGSKTPYGEMQYAYDAAQRLTARQVGGQPLEQFAYDPAGRLLAAAMPQAALQFAYDDADELTGITRANGVTSAFGYDASGQLLSLTHSLGAAPLYAQTYTYDSAGQRTTSALSSAQPLITQPVTNTYDAENHLLTSGATAYTYDANGNLVSEVGPAGTTVYTWDTRGRLISIAGPSGTTNFQYDPDGNLIAQQNAANGYTKYYVLDAITNVAAFGDNTGTSSAVLTALGLDSHLAVVPSSGPALYGLSDGLNSTVAVTDQSGTAKTHFAYEPFGQTTETGNDYPFQYTGRVPINSSLYYNRARFYNSVAGRFISEDPIGLDNTGNLYSYTGGNPVSIIDPEGTNGLIISGGVNGSFGSLNRIASSNPTIAELINKNLSIDGVFAFDENGVTVANTGTVGAGLSYSYGKSLPIGASVQIGFGNYSAFLGQSSYREFGPITTVCNKHYFGIAVSTGTSVSAGTSYTIPGPSVNRSYSDIYSSFKSYLSDTYSSSISYLLDRDFIRQQFNQMGLGY